MSKRGPFGWGELLSDSGALLLAGGLGERSVTVVDLFAGCGGWDLAALALGVDPLGVELDDDACATRDAVGLRTLRADVSALDPMDFAPCVGCLGSPPCPTFSLTGRGAGRQLEDVIRATIDDLAGGRDTRAERAGEAYRILEPETGMLAVLPEPRRARKRAQGRLSPIRAKRIAVRERKRATARKDANTSLLVVEPLRWAFALRPRWIALEQVPPVLPLWEATATALRSVGYNTWTGICSAERYGVPQTRKRAILIASLDGPVTEPSPTHSRYITPRQREELTGSLFGPEVAPSGRIVAPEDRELLPWVSMAEALGWDGGEWTQNKIRGAGMVERYGERPSRCDTTPSWTITAGSKGSGPRLEWRPAASVCGRETRERAMQAVHWRQRSNYSDGSSGSGTAVERGRTERSLDAPSLAVTSKGFQWVTDKEDVDGRVSAGRDISTPLPRDLREVPRLDRDEPVRDGEVREVRVRPEPNEPGGDWALVRIAQSHATERSVDEPAPTITGGHDHNERQWVLRAGTNANDCERSVDAPAPTLRFGARVNDVSWVLRSGQSVEGEGRAERSMEEPSRTVDQTARQWTIERPAPTVVGSRRSDKGMNGDPRISEPGRHDPTVSGSQQAKAVRVTLAEALVLQSFPPDYPVQGSKSAQYTQAGNAIPVPLAWHVLKAIPGLAPDLRDNEGRVA